MKQYFFLTEITKTKFADMFPQVLLKYKNVSVPIECKFNQVIKLSNSHKGPPDAMVGIFNNLLNNRQTNL